MSMRIEKTTTGCIITNPDLEMKRRVLHYFSLTNPVREFFIYHDPNRKKKIFNRSDSQETIHITSGFLSLKDKYIQGLQSHIKTMPAKDGAPISLNLNKTPRSDMQREMIHTFVTSNSPKITAELKPGVG